MTDIHANLTDDNELHNPKGFSSASNGSLPLRSSAGAMQWLDAGSDNQVLTISSGIPSWENNTSGFADPMTTRGDIIAKDASNNTTRIALGATNTILYSDGSDLTYGFTIRDEDTMSSDSATSLATQQSIKAYVDTQVAGVTVTMQGAFDGGQSITIANTDNQTFTINQNDTTNNPSAFTITNTGTGTDITAPNFTLTNGAVAATSIGAPSFKSAGGGTTVMTLTSTDVIMDKGLALADDGELVISSGVITVTGSRHSVDTESDASTDNLDTINGGIDGQLLYLETEDSGRNVVVKDGTGNISCSGDRTLDFTTSGILLIYNSALSTWKEVAFYA